MLAGAEDARRPLLDLNLKNTPFSANCAFFHTLPISFFFAKLNTLKKRILILPPSVPTSNVPPLQVVGKKKDRKSYIKTVFERYICIFIAYEFKNILFTIAR